MSNRRRRLSLKPMVSSRALLPPPRPLVMPLMPLVKKLRLN